MLQNFNLNFRAVCNNYYAFDNAYFLYTGDKADNKLIMAFQKGTLIMYKNNDIPYLQAFSDYVKRIGKDFEGFDKIELNEDYSKGVYIDEPHKEERKGFRL